MLSGGWRNQLKPRRNMPVEEYNANVNEFNKWQEALTKTGKFYKKDSLKPLTKTEAKQLKDAREALKNPKKTRTQKRHPWNAEYDITKRQQPDGSMLRYQTPKQQIEFDMSKFTPANIVKVLNSAGYKLVGQDEHSDSIYIFEQNVKPKTKRTNNAELRFFGDYVRSQSDEPMKLDAVNTLWRGRNDTTAELYAQFRTSPQYAEFQRLKSIHGSGLAEYLDYYFPEARKTIKSYAHKKINDWLGKQPKKKKDVKRVDIFE
jgi:hypothetical protein